MIAAPPPVLTVCARCEHTTIVSALAAAPNGATVIVQAGTYRGTITISRQVTLEGRDAVIDGGGRGTVVTVLAPGTRIAGFTITGSGADTAEVNAGVRVGATHVTIERDVFSGDAFGVVFESAPYGVIRDNTIASDRALSPERRGDGIRVFRSSWTRIEGNQVRDGRDAIIIYSDHVTFAGNRIQGNRYGIHDMFSRDLTVTGNSFEDCDVGSNFMYASGVHIERNVFAHNRGAAGYGVALESMDDVDIGSNAFVDNHVGISINASPASPGSALHVTGNLFAYNGAALSAPSITADASVTGNSFVDNLEQVNVFGGGALTRVYWTDHGAGNYWADYAGYDADGDGRGDVRYAPTSAFQSVADADPALAIFAYSPAVNAMDFAAKAFPAGGGGQAKLVDAAPLMRAAVPAGLPWTAGRGSTLATRIVALVSLAFLGSFALLLRRGTAVSEPSEAPRIVAPVVAADTAVSVRGLTKRFGSVLAVRDISFEVRPGEALALWGPNGAGKTTILRCLLGQIRYEGELRVAGHRPDPDDARSRVGLSYVPQALPAFDMSVGELAALVARLRGFGAADAQLALERMGLGDLIARGIPELSGGMRQRLALALALIGSPRLLILDEPAASLDRQTRRDMLKLLLAEKANGTTIVFSSHALDEVERLADRVVSLEEGRLMSVLPVADFTRSERAGDAS